MKKYKIKIEWILGDIPQTNTIPVWASSDANALNIAEGQLRRAAKSFPERSWIGPAAILEAA